MTYVIDASVVLKWFLPEPDSAAADLILEKFLNDESELVAPDVLLLEAASALWKRVKVRSELSVNDATLIYRDLLTLPLSLVAADTLADATLQSAMELNHSPYDCLYCALASQRGCDFLTADQVLVNKPGAVFPSIRHVVTLKS